MAQLTDDCFAFGGPLLTIDAATQLITERLPVIAGVESVPVFEADGRVLAHALTAPLPLPPFDNSAVDGYAVAHGDLVPGGATTLPVQLRLIAGDRTAASHPPGTATRIFTGAPMPAGADTVFMQEDVEVLQDGRVVLPAGLKLGANRRLAGEDLADGGAALPSGRKLGPAELSLAASLGLAQLTVRTRLRVAVFSTGNEVVAPGAPLAPGTLYDANRALLIALIRRTGCHVTDLGILPDQRAAVTSALADAASSHDLIITSGGVSTGEEDHVRAALEGAGSLVFWRMAIKPGRPVALGLINGCAFVGLPGNPVAVFVTYVRVARVLIARLAGETPVAAPALPVRLGFRYRKKAGRREYVRVRLVAEADGIVAHKHPRDGAGVITSLTETDGLVELVESSTGVVEGDMAPFLPYATLLA
ncbi:MAG: molybdopterin molybdenumtransferase MoeA [Alphaproteobacteria bacterium]|nr:MAG: molybdopterin molybdenumtransferase MoeA [Alphaproteobacteria bacterium]